jgi:hypothetical protein
MAGSLEPIPVVRRGFGRRFGVAYAALAVAFWATVAAGTVLLVGRGGGDHAQAWASWKPTVSGFAAARQIATHVGDKYRLDDSVGSPLTFVHPTSVDADRLAGFVWHSGAGELPSRKTLIYELCGEGASCEIAGRPSDAERQLVRREALELILYSYKYVEGYDSVVAFLPPEAGAPKKLSVVLFRDGELRNELHRPLRLTLSAARPITPSRLSLVERDTIEELTRPHWFNAEVRRLQSGSSILELYPVS